MREAEQDLLEFAAAASHDLGAPLRSIAGYAELLSERVDSGDPQAANALAAIGRAVDRMQTLVDGLLGFARTAEALEVEPVDTGIVVSETLAALEAEIDGAGAEIAAGELPEVLANRGQLHQLFQNLISNAIKYRSERELRIEIACHAEPGVWHFEVADNGVGISDQDRIRIFDLFGRARATRSIAGSGIGLAVSKRIVESHGGGIWVESDSARGSSFHFTLPRQLRRRDDPARADR